jgi:myo-inositol 2-dehydrogenase/D-chiro-inositol 1-dehydrogenase
LLLAQGSGLIQASDADRSIVAAKAAGLPLQVGFNRRFARAFREAQDVIAAGGIGTPQLLRSLTRDPGLANPGAVTPWTIFTQTLIHDFDALNWLNPGAEPVEVYAAADALVAPDFNPIHDRILHQTERRRSQGIR